MSRYYSILHWRSSALRIGHILPMSKFGSFDNYLILDFESTCEKNIKIDKQEIIEFPCIWADSNMNVISQYHRYVKPIHNPILTPHCTELTGILQTMVEKEDTFDKVLPDFLGWLQHTHSRVGKNQTMTFVTCGDWDLKIMLPEQCVLSKATLPASMTHWLNLKKVYGEITNYYPKSLKDMCQHLGLTFAGRQHSGIDDCRNILEIMKTLKSKYTTSLIR